MNATVAAIRTRAEGALVEQFAAMRTNLPGAGRVDALRAERFERFRRAGLPHRRVEAWHFTDLRGALREAFAPLKDERGGPAPALPAAAAPQALRLVLVDGFLRPELSDLDALPEGLRARSLAEALAEADEALLEALLPSGFGEDSVVDLNGALMAGGVVLDVAAGANIERPVELIWVDGAAKPGAGFARSLVRLGVGARLAVVESTAAATAERQVNNVLVAALDAKARLDHVAVSARFAQPSLRIETFLASLGADARLASTHFVCGAAFLRRQAFVRFDAEGAEAALAGLSLLRGSDHADNTIVVEHRAPRCRSRELFKHVVDERATGVFQGKAHVAPGAQKTDAVMASRAILLSDDAAMDNKPELEIFADDVVCGHGATCGALDQNQLFYAMARGLPRPLAEALLLEAFAGEALETIVDEPLREALRHRMRDWLELRGR